MSQDEKQQLATVNSRRLDQSSNIEQVDTSLDLNKSNTKQDPDNHLPTSSSVKAVKSLATKANHQAAANVTQTSSNAMPNNTQAKLVANLHSAANEGKVELVRLLLRCGADVNAQDEQVSFKFLIRRLILHDEPP